MSYLILSLNEVELYQSQIIRNIIILNFTFQVQDHNKQRQKWFHIIYFKYSKTSLLFTVLISRTTLLKGQC